MLYRKRKPNFSQSLRGLGSHSGQQSRTNLQPSRRGCAGLGLFHSGQQFLRLSKSQGTARQLHVTIKGMSLGSAPLLYRLVGGTRLPTTARVARFLGCDNPSEAPCSRHHSLNVTCRVSARRHWVLSGAHFPCKLAHTANAQ